MGVLTFKSEPAEVGIEKFSESIDRLVAGNAAAPVVDMSCTNYIPSKYLALIMKAAAACRVKGKELTLVCQPNVSKHFEQAGFSGIGRIATADAE